MFANRLILVLISFGQISIDSWPPYLVDHSILFIISRVHVSFTMVVISRVHVTSIMPDVISGVHVESTMPIVFRLVTSVKSVEHVVLLSSIDLDITVLLVVPVDLHAFEAIIILEALDSS